MLEKIRNQFKDFLNDDSQYEKLIRHLNGNHKGRLRFKHERLMEQFCTEVLGRSLSFDEVLEIFNVCCVHDEELVPSFVEAFHGEIDYSSIYLKAKMAKFPNAHTRPIPVADNYIGTTVPVLNCNKCLGEEKKFLDN